MSEEKIFRTTDYKLSTFLRTRNLPSETKPNPHRPRKAEFISPATDEIYKAVADYNKNESVPVQTYNENLEIVKDEVMEIVRSCHGEKHGAAR